MCPLPVQKHGQTPEVAALVGLGAGITAVTSLGNGQVPSGVSGWSNNITTTTDRVIVVRVPSSGRFRRITESYLQMGRGCDLDAWRTYAVGTTWKYIAAPDLTRTWLAVNKSDSSITARILIQDLKARSKMRLWSGCCRCCRMLVIGMAKCHNGLTMISCGVCWILLPKKNLRIGSATLRIAVLHCLLISTTKNYSYWKARLISRINDLIFRLLHTQ